MLSYGDRMAHRSNLAARTESEPDHLPLQELNSPETGPPTSTATETMRDEWQATASSPSAVNNSTATAVDGATTQNTDVAPDLPVTNECHDSVKEQEGTAGDTDKSASLDGTNAVNQVPAEVKDSAQTDAPAVTGESTRTTTNCAESHPAKGENPLVKLTCAFSGARKLAETLEAKKAPGRVLLDVYRHLSKEYQEGNNHLEKVDQDWYDRRRKALDGMEACLKDCWRGDEEVYGRILDQLAWAPEYACVCKHYRLKSPPNQTSMELPTTETSTSPVAKHSHSSSAPGPSSQDNRVTGLAQGGSFTNAKAAEGLADKVEAALQAIESFDLRAVRQRIKVLEDENPSRSVLLKVYRSLIKGFCERGQAVDESSKRWYNRRFDTVEAMDACIENCWQGDEEAFCRSSYDKVRLAPRFKCVCKQSQCAQNLAPAVSVKSGKKRQLSAAGPRSTKKHRNHGGVNPAIMPSVFEDARTRIKALEDNGNKMLLFEAYQRLFAKFEEGKNCLDGRAQSFYRRRASSLEMMKWCIQHCCQGDAEAFYRVEGKLGVGESFKCSCTGNTRPHPLLVKPAKGDCLESISTATSYQKISSPAGDVRKRSETKRYRPEEVTPALAAARKHISYRSPGEAKKKGWLPTNPHERDITNARKRVNTMEKKNAKKNLLMEAYRDIIESYSYVPDLWKQAKCGAWIVRRKRTLKAMEDCIETCCEGDEDKFFRVPEFLGVAESYKCYCQGYARRLSTSRPSKAVSTGEFALSEDHAAMLHADEVVFLGSHHDRGLAVIPPPSDGSAQGELSIIRKISRHFASVETRNMIRKKMRKGDDPSVRGIQSKRCEIFVRDASDKGSNFWEAQLRMAGLPVKSTNRLLEYAVEQARRDPRIRDAPHGYKFGNFSVILSYGSVQAQAPHLDLLSPNHQFLLVLTDESPSTCFYELADGDRIQKVSDLERVWRTMEQNGEAAFPDNLAQILGKSQDVATYLHDFGDVLHSSHTFRQIERFIPQVDAGSLLSLPGSVVHAAPTTKSFRAVLFFSAVPDHNLEIEYNPDNQFSNVLLSGLFLMCTWRNLKTTTEDRLYLLRRMAYYVRTAANRVGWERHFPNDSKFQNVIGAMTQENMSSHELDSHLQKAAKVDNLVFYHVQTRDFEGEFEVVSDGRLHTIWPTTGVTHKLFVYERKEDGFVLLQYPADRVEDVGDGWDDGHFKLVMDMEDVWFDGSNGTLKDTEGEVIECFLLDHETGERLQPADKKLEATP